MDVNWYRATDGGDRWVDRRAEQCDVRLNKWRVELRLTGFMSAL